MLHATSVCKTPRTTHFILHFFPILRRQYMYNRYRVLESPSSPPPTDYVVYASRIVTITQVDRRTRHTQQTLTLHEP